jgi:cell division protein FtsB
MGSFGGGNKGAAQANSQAQKQLNEQKRLNDVQIGNLNAETAKLAQQRQAAEAEAARIADENQRKKDLIAKRNGGRTSLIATSELGLADTLG